MTALHCPRSVPWTMFAGQAVRVGAWWSVTVTVKVQALVRALVSVAVQVTVVVPLAKSVPLTGLQTKVTPGQLSVAVSAGAWWSVTVTVKVHALVRALVSVAVQVTVVVPLAKSVPLTGLQTKVTPGQLSVAVGAKVTWAVQAPASVFTAILAGQVISG